MAHTEWYRHWFASPYYAKLYVNRNEEEAQQFITQLLAFINPKPGSLMLDVACGQGRHSKCLARMGYDVSGIDLSEPFINEAKQFEAPNLHFYLHDMRLPFWINYFDYAFNFFTSFGYFRTMREHDAAARTIAQSLKLNGLFVIDYLNVHYVEDNLVKEEVKVIDGISFNITRWHDDDHFFKQVKITDDKAGVKQTFTERVAKFSLGDFTDMLAYQGMQVQDVFGNYGLSSYDVRKSPRMIIVAKKMRY